MSHALRIAAPDAAVPQTPPARVPSSDSAATLAGLSDRQRATLLARVSLVTAWLSFRRSSGAALKSDTALRRFLVNWLQVAPDGEIPSPRTLRRWASAYESHGEVGLLDCRVSGSGRGNAAACDDELWRQFRGVYLSEQQLSLAACYDYISVLHARLPSAERAARPWPSLRVIRFRVAQLDPREVCLLREGRTEFSRRYTPRVTQDHADYAAGTHWIGDHHTLDLVAQFADGATGRPSLTLWIDMGSRHVMGWRIVPTPSSDSIIASFADGARLHGLPTDVTLDNGKDYRAAAFAGGRKTETIAERLGPTLLSDLGVSVHWTATYSPEAKGTIERFFRTVCDRFSKWYPSYIGGRPDRRPEDIHADIRSGAVALPTLAALESAFADFLAMYHARDHRGQGMNGQSPAEVLAASDAPRRMVPDTPVAYDPHGQAITLFDLKLMRPVAGTQRAPLRCGRDGVTFRGLRYRGPIHLHQPHVGADVMFRVPESAEWLVVCDLDGRVLFVATQDQIIGSGASHETLRRTLAERKRAARDLRRAAQAHRELARPLPQQVLATQAKAAGAAAAAVGQGSAPLVGRDPDRPRNLLLAGLTDFGAGHAPLPAPRVYDVTQLPAPASPADVTDDSPRMDITTLMARLRDMERETPA